MSQIKTHIEFKSNFGFVPGKYVNQAIKLLKSLEPSSHEHLQRGWDGHISHVYLKTQLTSVEVRQALTAFIQMYEGLYFYVTVTK